jgi:hypothetical protein
MQNVISNSNWRQATNLEMEILHQNGTWELVPLPPIKQIVGCKWVYNAKFNHDGLIER